MSACLNGEALSEREALITSDQLKEPKEPLTDAASQSMSMLNWLSVRSGGPCYRFLESIKQFYLFLFRACRSVVNTGVSSLSATASLDWTVQHRVGDGESSLTN